MLRALIYGPAACELAGLLSSMIFPSPSEWNAPDAAHSHALRSTGRRHHPPDFGLDLVQSLGERPAVIILALSIRIGDILPVPVSYFLIRALCQIH